MKEEDIAIDRLLPAEWNPNEMDREMRDRLCVSLDRFGLVLPLTVRPVDEDLYEVIGGNQRLEVLLEAGYKTLSCVVVQADDTEARLLAQALNNIQGHDDMGVKAELVREVLRVLPHSEVLKVLPESADSLRDLSTLGQGDMAASLRAWDQARAARLRHMTFQLAKEQVDVVEEALETATSGVAGGQDNPNRRGNALYRLSLEYLNNIGGKTLE